MEISAGRLCRFKPREQWPPAVKQSIPDEKLYFIHPVIIFRGIIDGTVDVVTTTSTPALATNHKNYIRISTTNSRLPTDLNSPLIVNHKMPKDSWAVLDSKRHVPVTILEPWIERGEQFKIGCGSTKRLHEKVNERMAAIARSTSVSHVPMTAATVAPRAVPPPPPPNPSAAASTNPWARAMAPPGPPPSVPLPDLPPLPVPAPAPLSTHGKPPPPQPHAASPPSAQAPTPALTKLPPLSLGASPKSDESVDIADIKKSLAELKLAVVALEGLCDTLEARTETTHTTQPPSSSPEHTAHHPPPPTRDDKAARILGIDSETVMAAEKTEAEKKEGKTSRLRRWGSRIFMLKEG